MRTKAWGIFCSKNEVEIMKGKLEKSGRDIFEIRPLTYMERMTYVKDPILFSNEPHIIMFHATTLQYRWFTFINRLTRVM